MKQLLVLVAWLASLAIVAVMTAQFAGAQVPGMPTVTGGDIGVRVTGIDRHGNPTGVLVVRIDGEWRELRSQVGVVPIR